MPGLNGLTAVHICVGLSALAASTSAAGHRQVHTKDLRLALLKYVRAFFRPRLPRSSPHLHGDHRNICNGPLRLLKRYSADLRSVRYELIRAKERTELGQLQIARLKAAFAHHP